MAHIMKVGTNYYKYHTKQIEGKIKRIYMGKVTQAEYELYIRNKKLKKYSKRNKTGKNK